MFSLLEFSHGYYPLVINALSLHSFIFCLNYLMIVHFQHYRNTWGGDLYKEVGFIQLTVLGQQILSPKNMGGFWRVTPSVDLWLPRAHMHMLPQHTHERALTCVHPPTPTLKEVDGFPESWSLSPAGLHHSKFTKKHTEFFNYFVNNTSALIFFSCLNTETMWWLL